eukprot:10860874-Alexandrium_andersonii.AAC.1
MIAPKKEEEEEEQQQHLLSFPSNARPPSPDTFSLYAKRLRTLRVLIRNLWEKEELRLRDDCKKAASKPREGRGEATSAL